MVIDVLKLKKAMESTAVDTTILQAAARLQGLKHVIDICEGIIEKLIEVEQSFGLILSNEEIAGLVVVKENTLAIDNKTIHSQLKVLFDTKKILK